MSGGKKLISALLALAMVGQLGLTVGMADGGAATSAWGAPSCNTADHGMTLHNVANASSCNSPMHWFSSSTAFSSLSSQSSVNYFYPTVNTTIYCTGGLTDIIVLDKALRTSGANIIVSITDFSGEDRIVIPDGASVSGYVPESGEDETFPSSSDSAQEGNQAELSVTGGNEGGKAWGVRLFITGTLPSGTSFRDLVETMPSSELKLTYSVKDENPTLTVGGYAADSYAGKAGYTFLRETKKSGGLDYEEIATVATDTGAQRTITSPEPDDAVYRYVVVENGTGRIAATEGCSVTPKISGDISISSSSPSFPSNNVVSTTTDLTLTAGVAYSGPCDNSSHQNGGSGSHDYEIIWKAKEEVPGVTVNKNGAVQINSAALTPNTTKEVVINLTASKNGSETVLGSFSFQVKGADTPANEEPPEEGTEGWNGPLKIVSDAPETVNITKDTTLTYSTDIPPEELGINYRLDWTLTPTAGYIRVDPKDDASATVTISKAGIPKEGIKAPGETFTLIATAVPIQNSVQAKAIAAFAVVPIDAAQGPTAEATITVTADAAPDEEPKDPDDTGNTPATPGSSGGSSSSGSSGSSSGSSSSSSSGSSSSSAESKVKIESSNPTPGIITITNSSATKVSYDYSAVPTDGKAEDYTFAWTLTNPDYPTKPDYIALTWSEDSNRATVTVTKSKLPDESVDTTFDLTVTLKPRTQSLSTLSVQPLAATGELTQTYSIRVYAPRRVSASSSSSSSNTSGFRDLDHTNRNQWLDIEQSIERAAKGSTVKATLGDNVNMPYYIFNDLKGQDVSLQMKVSGGYTWTVNGRSVRQLPGNQLMVSLGIKTYSNSKMTSLCRDSQIKGFQLVNDDSYYGDFRLTMNLGSRYAKKTVYLYSYDAAKNKLTYASSAKAADNGEVDFTFTRSLGAYAVTSKALYGESAVTTGGGAVGSGNRPTAIYPPEAAAAPYQPPASEAPSGSGSSEPASSSAASSREPSSAPDTTPVDVVVQPEPEPENAPIPVIVPLLILGIAGVIAATVVVVNNSRSRGSFDFDFE